MLKSLRLHQVIAQKFGVAILAGAYQPGDCLKGEIEQSLAMGVSRTPYREAIRILIAKGLLESRPRVGTHVTPRHQWNLLDPDVLAWMFMGQPNERFIRDLFELRELIEPAAAALAAARHTKSELDVMADALDRMEQHGLATPEGQEADREFHHALLTASHNEALASLSSSVGAAVQWTTHFNQRASGRPRNPIREHRAVFKAIARSNPDLARAAMIGFLDVALADMTSASG